jgi:hypothetical protein
MSMDEKIPRLFGIRDLRINKSCFWWDQTIHQKIKAVTDWEIPKTNDMYNLF